jgi:hypothetical protein
LRHSSPNSLIANLTRIRHELAAQIAGLAGLNRIRFRKSNVRIRNSQGNAGLFMTTLIAGMTRFGWMTLMAIVALCLPFSALKAEKYYKLTEPIQESTDGSKPKPPEPSKPVDPNMFKKFLVVDASAQRVDYYEDGSVTFSTPASTGKAETATKPGLYRVTNKHEKWTSTIYDVPMPHFLRLNNSAVGLHAGYLPGYPASHGCIRLPEDAAVYLFETVAIGTPVLIQGTPPDKEWIKSQYKVKRAPSSTSYNSKSGKKMGEEWKPPYPIVGVSWIKPADPKTDSQTEKKTETAKPEPKKKKTTQTAQQ